MRIGQAVWGWAMGVGTETWRECTAREFRGLAEGIDVANRRGTFEAEMHEGGRVRSGPKQGASRPEMNALGL